MPEQRDVTALPLIPIVRRIAMRANIEIARHQDVPLILTPDELEALLDAYERGGFES